jgi:very-short-patch-repair endonuclease
MPEPHALPALTGPQSHEVDARIARIAARQEFVVSMPQLAEAGLMPRAARKRVAAGRLWRIHRGVYATVPKLSRRGHFFAAVLACGDGAVLSHQSAAHEHKIRKHEYGPVHVTVPRTGARSRGGIVVHVSAHVPSQLIDGLRVTTSARTLTDLADTLTPTQLQLATSTAERLNLVDRAQLRPEPGRRSPVNGRHVFTRSENERAFLRLCRTRDLPLPETNIGIGRWEVDALWPEYGLAVEIDAWHTHGNPHTFETDRRKDEFCDEIGLKVRRVTDVRLHEDPDGVSATLRRALSACRFVPGRTLAEWRAVASSA